MVSTNTERKIEMVLDYPGYEIRISNQKGGERTIERGNL
jgi:pyruvate kinase